MQFEPLDDWKVGDTVILQVLKSLHNELEMLIAFHKLLETVLIQILHVKIKEM